jgi:hypothetical protein
LNVYKGTKADVYIGRLPSGMHWGNPFSHLYSTNVATIKVKTRDEAIECFRQWISGTAFQSVEPERRAWILANLKDLKGKTLGCFCSPKSCHGEILAELADALPE